MLPKIISPQEYYNLELSVDLGIQETPKSYILTVGDCKPARIILKPIDKPSMIDRFKSWFTR